MGWPDASDISSLQRRARQWKLEMRVNARNVARTWKPIADDRGVPRVGHRGARYGGVPALPRRWGRGHRAGESSGPDRLWRGVAHRQGPGNEPGSFPDCADGPDDSDGPDQ